MHDTCYGWYGDAHMFFSSATESHEELILINQLYMILCVCYSYCWVSDVSRDLSHLGGVVFMRRLWTHSILYLVVCYWTRIYIFLFGCDKICYWKNKSFMIIILFYFCANVQCFACIRSINFWHTNAKINYFISTFYYIFSCRQMF